MDWNQCGVWSGSVFFIGVKSEAISRYPLYLLPARKGEAHGQKDAAAIGAKKMFNRFFILRGLTLLFAFLITEVL